MNKKLLLVFFSVFVFGLCRIHSSVDAAGEAGYWGFDENGGYVASDTSGNFNHGVLTNDVSWTPGKSGSALSFGGSGYVSIPMTSGLQPSGAVTVAAWVKVSGIQDYYAIVSSYGSPNPPGASCNGGTAYTIRFSPDGKPSFGVTTGNNNLCAEDYVLSPDNVSLNAWHHIAGVYNGSQIVIYVDGAPKGYFSKTGTLIPQDSLEIGATKVYGQQYNFMRGVIDEAKVYTRALSASEISQLASQFSCTPNCSGKVCGSDACGGSCGTCASGQTCNASGQCVVGQGICAAGEVSACKVCKSDGLGWADDGSKCATGQKCSLGQCVSVPSDSDCTAKTCSSAGYECGAWNDACGGIFDCGACAAGKSCSAAGKCVDGAAASQADIKINGDDGPISAKPNTLITLSWISNNTNNCTASGNWSGSKALSGYESVVMSSGSMVFSLSCTGDQGTVSDSITVNAAAFGIGLAESIEISSGATATLSAEITGTAPSSPVYQWSCTGGSLSDSSILSPVYTAPAVTSDKRYVCTLTVRDGNAAAVSKKINVNVKPVPQNVVELEKQIAEIKALIESLQKQLAALAGLPATGAGSAKYSCAQLTKYLVYNTQNDPEVKCLQEFLIAQGFSGVTATGNYQTATRDAVKAFQEKYAAEILAPYGLTYGSGNVGNDTRRKINALMAAGQ